MDRDDLEKLDDLRYSDPQRARELAEEALEAAPAPLSGAVPGFVPAHAGGHRHDPRVDQVARAPRSGASPSDRRSPRSRDQGSETGRRRMDPPLGAFRLTARVGERDHPGAFARRRVAVILSGGFRFTRIGLGLRTFGRRWSKPQSRHDVHDVIP